MRPSSVRQGHRAGRGTPRAGSRPPRCSHSLRRAARTRRRRQPSGCPASRDAPRRLAHRAAVERHEGAAVVLVAASHHRTCRARGAARSFGQSTKGGSEAPDGRPMRIAATRVRSRRCTTALVKWVVPIITRVEADRRPRDCRQQVGAAPCVMPLSHVRGGRRLDRLHDLVPSTTARRRCWCRRRRCRCASWPLPARTVRKSKS